MEGVGGLVAHRGVQGVAPAGDAAAGEQVVGRVEEGGDELVGAFLNDADHAPAVLGGGQGGVADGAVGGEVGEVVVAADGASPEALAQAAAARAEVAGGQAVVLDAVGTERHEFGGFQLAGMAGGGGFDDLVLQLLVLQVVEGDGGQEVQGQAGGQGLHGQVHDRRVAAVPVGEQEALETVVQQGGQLVFQDVQEGLGAQRDGAGEAHVVGGHAVGHGWGDEQAGVEAFGQAQREVLADHEVGV